MFEMVTNCSGASVRGKGPYLQEGTVRKVKKQKATDADGKEYVIEAIVDKLADITFIRKFIVDKKNKQTGVETPGGRLHIPEACPVELRVLMMAIWASKKEERPSALQCVLFLLHACAPIMGEARAWENDVESATKMKEWLVGDLGIPVPRAMDVFGEFNYESLVDDGDLLSDTKSVLGEAGSDFVLSETFKAMQREIKALKMLNEAVKQEPLKSALAKACEDAEEEKGKDRGEQKGGGTIQETLGGALEAAREEVAARRRAEEEREDGEEKKAAEAAEEVAVAAAAAAEAAAAEAALVAEVSRVAVQREAAAEQHHREVEEKAGAAHNSVVRVCRQYKKSGMFNSTCKNCGDPKKGHYAGSNDALYLMCMNDASKPDMNKFNALINAGIDIRYKDSDKWTALMNAAVRGYVDAVKAMVAADPDPVHLNIKNADGDTALDRAIFWDNNGRAGCAECVAVLRAAGAEE